MQQPPFRAFEILLRALNSRIAAKAIASEIPQSTMIRTIIFETYRPAARSIERINPSQRVASLIVTRALTPGFPNRNTASAFCRRIVFSQSLPCRAAGAIVWARLRSTDEVVNADDFSAEGRLNEFFWAPVRSALFVPLSDKCDPDLVAVDPCQRTAPVSQSGRGKQKEELRQLKSLDRGHDCQRCIRFGNIVDHAVPAPRAINRHQLHGHAVLEFHALFNPIFLEHWRSSQPNCLPVFPNLGCVKLRTY
jgi:hypothetical protein